MDVTWLTNAVLTLVLATTIALGDRPSASPIHPPQRSIQAPGPAGHVFRAAVLRTMVGRESIGRLTRRAPVLGGRWYVGSARDVRFLGGNLVAVTYEDGHVAGQLVARVIVPADVRTWQVLRDEAR
jgi:hypothetical protein